MAKRGRPKRTTAERARQQARDADFVLLFEKHLAYNQCELKLSRKKAAGNAAKRVAELFGVGPRTVYNARTRHYRGARQRREPTAAELFERYLEPIRQILTAEELTELAALKGVGRSRIVQRLINGAEAERRAAEFEREVRRLRTQLAAHSAAPMTRRVAN